MGLIYLNSKNEKRVMYLVEIVKFCNATLEKVLKEVKLKIFQSEPWKKPPLLGEIDRDIKRAFEREITKRLKHREQMRTWESFVNERPILPTMKQIPNDIYNSVDACKNAKEMWERIRRLMFGSDVTNHIRHSRLMDEFENFTAKEGELLESVYERLTTLVNIMDHNNVFPILVSINTKFLNCLQPEWSKYVTIIRHNQIGETVSYDQLYYSLVQFEPHVQASKAKRADWNHDPLALIAHSNASSSQSHANPSYSQSPQSYYVTHPSSVVDYEEDYRGELQGDS
ncbi:hypothetical protein Tco_1314552 [Tanacetum coccineum]